MLHLFFYVPVSHIENVKSALFEAGAGKIGNYSNCAWQTLGEGQFMPLENSQPFLGTQNQIEKVQEYKVEMVCEERFIKAVIDALKKSHPYEEPAYCVTKIER